MKPYKEMTVMKEFFRKNEALKVYQKKEGSLLSRKTKSEVTIQPFQNKFLTAARNILFQSIFYSFYFSFFLNNL